MNSVLDPSRPFNGEAPDSFLDSKEVSDLNKILSFELGKMASVEKSESDSLEDPTSPLYSTESFAELKLKPELLQTCLEIGYIGPSKIQSACIPLIIRTPPVDVVAQAQNGTGKTATFLLALLHRINVDLPAAQAIVMAPTIELAQQIEKVAIKLSGNLPGLKTFCCVRGSEFSQGGPHTEQLVIGTPGAIENHVCKFRSLDIRNVFCVVMDEADHIFALQGSRDKVWQILGFLRNACPNIQLLFFSATFNDQSTEDVIANFAPNACRIETRKRENILSRIKQYLVICNSREDKFKAILRVYTSICVTSSIIFVYTRSSVDWLEQKIRATGRNVATLHGGLTPEERAVNVTRFSESKVKVLIATDVAARGLDIPQVCLVVNYDPPLEYQNSMNQQKSIADCETYLHRVGRTGRFGKPGLCINLVDNSSSLDLFKQIEAYYEMKMQVLDVSNFEVMDKLSY